MEHRTKTEKKQRKPRPSVAANMVKKLLVGMPQRLLDAPNHPKALREWCERVRSALHALGEAPSTRPVDVDIGNLARFLMEKLDAPPRHDTPPMPARSAIQDMRYTPVGMGPVHIRPHAAASTMDTAPSASRT
jgi:hypothetical protein